jgi:hypothetical protein
MIPDVDRQMLLQQTSGVDIDRIVRAFHRAFLFAAAVAALAAFTASRIPHITLWQPRKRRAAIPR